MLRDINEWRVIQENLGGTTLGLSNRHKIGGVVGSNFQDDDLEDNDGLEDEDDLEDNDDEFGDDELDSGEEFDDEQPDEDEFSQKNANPDKKFPPEDPEEMSNDYLNDIDPNLLGDDMGDGEDMNTPEKDMGIKRGTDTPEKDMGTEGDMDNPEGDMQEMPCPECNPEGLEQEGDPQCPSCQGLGFVMPEESMDGEDNLGEEPEGEFDNMPTPPSKGMTNRQPRYESTDFITNLANQARGNHYKKYSSGFQEDFLITPTPEEPKPGEVGFAPQGSLNSVGGGYTMKDFEDIPVLESKYPTLNQYKAKKKKKKSR